jgi:hypothetical protein
VLVLLVLLLCTPPAVAAAAAAAARACASALSSASGVPPSTFPLSLPLLAGLLRLLCGDSAPGISAAGRFSDHGTSTAAVAAAAAAADAAGEAVPVCSTPLLLLPCCVLLCVLLLTVPGTVAVTSGGNAKRACFCGELPSGLLLGEGLLSELPLLLLLPAAAAAALLLSFTGDTVSTRSGSLTGDVLYSGGSALYSASMRLRASSTCSGGFCCRRLLCSVHSGQRTVRTVQWCC